MAEQMMNTPQYVALSNIESYVSTVEYEVAGLRVAVNEALLYLVRAGESADRKAIERVRALAERAMSVVSRGCTCPGDDCTGCRRGEPMGWDLDPAQVLAALDGESDG